MENKNKFKKGDKAIIYIDDKRHPAETVTVVSVGSKYIKVEGTTNDKSFYHIEDGTCKDWTAWHIVPFHSVKEYEEYLKLKEIRRNNIKTLLNVIKAVPEDKEKEIDKIIIQTIWKIKSKIKKDC